MTPAARIGLFTLTLGLVPVLTGVWTSSAAARLHEAESVADVAAPGVAIAQAADDDYCTVELKKVLRRVLQSCGLLASGEVRGCQPLEAKQVATLAGEDFNAIFLPLHERAGIVEFERDSAELDAADRQMLERLFAEQRGASYFLVVARSSPDGSPVHNRALSEQRGKAVLDHLRGAFPEDADLDKEVGLLWLGEEFAQLDGRFCAWDRSSAPRPDGALAGAPPAGACDATDLNRSAFVSWVDCRL